MHKCFSIILYAACTFRPYKSTPVLKPFRTFTGKMTRRLSLQMVFSPLFVETLLCQSNTSQNISSAYFLYIGKCLRTKQMAYSQ